MQDAILELCVDVFLLHIAHVETARAGAGEGFAPQIAALLILFVIAVAAHCLNGQVAVVQIHLNVFLLAARQVNRYFVAVVRLFVRYLGCSVYEYLTNYRITKAKELLLMRRDRKIQEIAHDVGYTDSSHFIVMFKKLTGMTPAQFRRQ